MITCRLPKFLVELEDVSTTFVNSKFCNAAFHLKGKFYESVPLHDQPYCSLTKPLSDTSFGFDIFSAHLSTIKFDIVDNINDNIQLNFGKLPSDNIAPIDDQLIFQSNKIIRDTIVSLDPIGLTLLRPIEDVFGTTDTVLYSWNKTFIGEEQSITSSDFLNYRIYKKILKDYQVINDVIILRANYNTSLGDNAGVIPIESSVVLLTKGKTENLTFIDSATHDFNKYYDDSSYFEDIYEYEYYTNYGTVIKDNHYAFSINKRLNDTPIVLEQISHININKRLIQEAIVEDNITLFLSKGLMSSALSVDTIGKQSIKFLEDLSYFDSLYLIDSYTNYGILIDDSLKTQQINKSMIESQTVDDVELHSL